jgi:hypothetical protein
MQQIQNKLAALLKELDPGSKTKINKFARQLLEGSADEKKLSSIMDELAQIKASILLCIQMANVGVMRDMNRQIVADAAKIERIDSNLQKQLEQLDDYEGLRIARLIKGRRPSGKLSPYSPPVFRFTNQHSRWHRSPYPGRSPIPKLLKRQLRLRLRQSRRFRFRY